MDADGGEWFSSWQCGSHYFKASFSGVMSPSLMANPLLLQVLGGDSCLGSRRTRRPTCGQCGLSGQVAEDYRGSLWTWAGSLPL